MAQFPLTAQSGFETGALDSGFALTDASALTLGYLHYVDCVNRFNMTPWRGAYCWGINNAVAAGDCYLTVAAMNVAASSYWCVGFALYLKGHTMANGNRTSLVKVVSAGPVDETCLQLYYTTAGGYQLLFTEAFDTAVGANPVWPITQNQWHWIEMHGIVDSGGGNDGISYLKVDGYAVGTLATLDQAAITDVLIGSLDQDAGHTAGYIFYDDIYMHLDTAAVRFGLRSQYPMNPHISAIASVAFTDCLFVGPGTVRSANLLTHVANDILRLYDTDVGVTTGIGGARMVAETGCIDVDASDTPIDGPLYFERGCTALLTPGGAGGARAIVNIDQAPPAGYPVSYCYGSKANLKQYALCRTTLPGGV